ncbi:unnamed protein product [Adineta ricciae]|uniref:Uncharacterized protein n=1 Tax=Adineta ricciae TaxID=249248 RepID=A0A814YA21_ADIRI|nr:unnamed protein product [Adineta ricciae]
MYYVPVTDTYYRVPVSHVPIYPTVTTTRLLVDDSNAKLNNDLTRVQKELADLREELADLRLEKDITCRLCSSRIESTPCDLDCIICYPPTRRLSYSRSPSPVHYCSICHDYVTDETYVSPPSLRPSSTRPKKKLRYEEDRLSEYLSRQLDLQRLRGRPIPEELPVWIPTAYKQDYPHRRWATRQSYFSEP